MFFSATYDCEKRFFAYFYTVNKHRNWSQIESDMQIQLSNVDPHIFCSILK